MSLSVPDKGQRPSFLFVTNRSGELLITVFFLLPTPRGYGSDPGVDKVFDGEYDCDGSKFILFFTGS